MLSGSPIGKEIIRSLGAALDPAFDKACMIESVISDDDTVRSMGYHPPQAPPGFTETDTLIDRHQAHKGL